MVYEVGKSSIAPTQLIGHYCRSESRLASIPNGIERHSYEVWISIFLNKQVLFNVWIICTILKIQDAITALNALQTNAITLQKSISRAHDNTCLHVKETEKYLEKVGVTLDNLDQLSVIHVAGTKGKVSNL